MGSLKALLMGYILFETGGKRFLRYGRALSEVDRQLHHERPAESKVMGLHIARGWRTIYSLVRIYPSIQPTITLYPALEAASKVSELTKTELAREDEKWVIWACEK